MSILTNIYPPTLPTYGDTFTLTMDSSQLTGTGICRIYFSISQYNTIKTASATTGDIYPIAQVVVSKQNTTLSALKKEWYPCDIMFTDIKTDGERSTVDKYYIEIRSVDLEDNSFAINTYYKVQIRFIDSTLADDSSKIPTKTIDSETGEEYYPGLNNGWFIENLDYFSEWSTVCLIRGISSSYLSLRGVDTSVEQILWKCGNVDIIGTVKFSSPQEEDSLKLYNIQLYKNTGELLIDSGDIYADSYVGRNEIKYTLKRLFKEGERYILHISYTTKTLYTNVDEYNILIISDGSEKLDVVINHVEDEENGRIVLNIQGNATDVYNGTFIIRRSCSDTDFTVWEDVANITIDNEILDYTWVDYTVQSGRWYKYGVQNIKLINGVEQRGILTICQEELIVNFEDIFLNSQGRQLNIRFNPQISSYQETILENKVDTIGSKYPKIKRNGNVKYKQFNISGLITQFMDKHSYYSVVNGSLKNNLHFYKEEGIHNPFDTEALFVSKEELYGEEVLALYDWYNDQHNIYPINDIVYETDFRKAVMDFLYADTVKLYRSATEGNILVKLMNITFTPNQTLGRKVWNFSATAYEIDECSIENYDKYNIQTLAKIEPYFEYVNNFIGQINQTIPANTEVLSTILTEKYSYDTYIKEGYTPRVDHLKYLRIEFTGAPYLIVDNGTGPVPLPNGSSSTNALLGYIVYINDVPIAVSAQQGFYELKNNDVAIREITFPVNTAAILNYELVLSQEYAEETPLQSMVYFKRVSQANQVFDKDIDLVNLMKEHFAQAGTSNGVTIWYQALLSIDGIRVEADEGTILKVKEAGEEEPQIHIIGPTGSLDFYDPESVIEEAYLTGVHLVPAQDYELQRDNLSGNRYVETGIIRNNTNEIVNPVINGIYTIAGQRYIWYQNNWYQVSNNDDIECPVAALVDYYCEIVKGYYAN